MYVPSESYAVFNLLLYRRSARAFILLLATYTLSCGHRNWEVILAYNRLSLVSAQLEEGLAVDCVWCSCVS